MKLSIRQQEIVDSNDKYCYVIAGAGSGKTRTLTEKIKKLVSNNNQGAKVLAITFSNKAAKELKDRLLVDFNQVQLDELVYVGTIHNFCMELVLQRGSVIGLSSELTIFDSFEDRFTVFLEALEYVPQIKIRYIENGVFNENKARGLFLTFCKAKRNLKLPNDYDSYPSHKQLYVAYNELMLAQNAIDFDDILIYAYKILSDNPSIARIYQRTYRYIFVDEAQDLNKSQYELVKVLAGDQSSLFLVGDPNQAIYGFNGSSSKFMCESFPQDYNAKKYTLIENFRSSKSVIDAAKIIEPTFSIEGQLPIEGCFKIKEFSDDIAEANWIVNTIEYLIQNGHPDVDGNQIKFDDIAVIGRNKYVFGVLQKVLTDQNIKYHLRVSKDEGLSSESIVFRIFDKSLLLLVNSRDILHFNELLSIINLPNSEFESFSELRKSNILDSFLGTSTSEFLRSVWNVLDDRISDFKFDKILSLMREYCDDINNFLDENERLLAFSDHISWVDRWHNYVKSTSIEERNLANFLRQIALGVTNVQKLTDLTLSTVHMTKGLEFNVVFIMGVNEGIFPDRRSLENSQDLQEERHNMFVSITRSRRICFITYPLQTHTPWGVKRQTPSRFVKELIELNK